MKNIMYIIIGISFLTFYACHSGHDHEGEHAHAHDEEETSDEHAHGSGAQEDVDEVTLTREQMDLIQVDFAHIEKKELSNTLKANGLLKVPNQNKATITALMGGVVQEILVNPGQYVQKGKAIVSLKNTSYIQLQEKYLQIDRLSLILTRQVF
jgi:cobalt-zinc-cadmium efflux system membrane fusion protein